MNNQTVTEMLTAYVREEDSFLIRATKCVAIHMKYCDSFDSEVRFKMRTVTKNPGFAAPYTTALLVKTDVFEYLDVLFSSFIDNAVPGEDEGDDDLDYLRTLYLRERAKGVEVGYAEVTFLLNGDLSEITLSTDNNKIRVGNLTFDESLRTIDNFAQGVS